MCGFSISSLSESLQIIAAKCDKNKDGKIDGDEISIFFKLASNQQEKIPNDIKSKNPKNKDKAKNIKQVINNVLAKIKNNEIAQKRVATLPLENKSVKNFNKLEYQLSSLKNSVNEQKLDLYY